jgi:hypothetical protein
MRQNFPACLMSFENLLVHSVHVVWSEFVSKYYVPNEIQPFSPPVLAD